MEKITVLRNGSPIELGDCLRNLITSFEERKDHLKLELRYLDATQENSATILTNLEKIGIINWISPQFKTPSWALPLAHYSRISSSNELWYLLMDPYRYVEISCAAQDILSHRSKTTEDLVKYSLYCFKPLQLLTTYGYASMTATHFSDGCDVKAITIRRNQCDTSNDRNENDAYLSPSLYDSLQRKIWYPSEEISSVAVVLDIDDNFRKKSDLFAENIGNVTYYLFDKNGMLRKTLKKAMIVSTCSEEKENIYKANSLQNLINSVTTKDEVLYKKLIFTLLSPVVTSVGVVEATLKFNVNSNEGIDHRQRENFILGFVNSILVKSVTGQQSGGKIDLLPPALCDLGHTFEFNFTEELFDDIVNQNRDKTSIIYPSRKSLGSYEGILSGIATFSNTKK